MKSYNEMAQSVLNRINEYETVKKRKKKIFIRAAFPACCLCAAVIAGVAIHGAGENGTVPTPQSSSPDSRENISESSENSSGSDGKKFAYADDRCGVVIVDGKEYIQDFTDYAIDETFTADKSIGDARDFEGTYKMMDGIISAEIYTVKESKNVLLVKLSNGGTVVLIRDGELCVGGKDYRFYGYGSEGEKREKRIGKAKPYIIDVPTRGNNISPDDVLWTVSGDENKLIAVKSDGTQNVYRAVEQTKIANDPWGVY